MKEKSKPGCFFAAVLQTIRKPHFIFSPLLIIRLGWGWLKKRLLSHLGCTVIVGQVVEHSTVDPKELGLKPTRTQTFVIYSKKSHKK